MKIKWFDHFWKNLESSTQRNVVKTFCGFTLGYEKKSQLMDQAGIIGKADQTQASKIGKH